MVSDFESFPSPNTSHLNEVADILSEKNAQSLRKDVIKLVHESFSLFLESDRTVLAEDEIASGTEDTEVIDETDAREQPKIPTRVLAIDMLASPGLIENELEDVLTYKLVRTKPRAPGITFGADRIQIMMPVPDDFAVENPESKLPEAKEDDTPEEMERKSRLFVKFEKDTPDGAHIRRFAISLGNVYEYVALGDPDHNSEASDILDRDIHYLGTGEKRLGSLMLAQLLEDHKNFTLVPLVGKKRFQ